LIISDDENIPLEENIFMVKENNRACELINAIEIMENKFIIQKK